MGNSSPVYDAIKNIESLFELDDQICVFSYQNQEHFNGLWNLLASSPPQFNVLAGTFVIVWDGIPARGSKNDVVDTSKYLTPIDWAVAFSLFVKNQCKDAYPNFKILIVGVDPHSTDVNNLRHSLVFTPWIRLLMPNTVDSLIFCLLNSDSQSMQEVFSNNKGDMDFIRNLWVARLTKPSTPGDHHALANIIGPVLLMGDKGADAHLTALRHLMTALDLIPGNKEGCTLLTKDNPWIKWDELNLEDVLKEPSSKLELILIDDQYTQGWGKMLCLAAGTEYIVPDVSKNGLQTISTKNNKVTVRAASSPDSRMLDKLKGDQRFSLVLDEQNTDGKKPEILFLDLRLFSGRDISEEVTFFDKLIPLARKLTEEANNNLPWPGFSKDEIKLVEKWCLCKDKKREDDIYITALTFLPRILALTDLSLPIILFSSTGRRDIAEKLKPYGNIITTFDKPKFTVDIPLDIAEQTKGKFHEAVGEAIKLLKARQKCRFINKNRDSFIQSKKYNKGVHIELFIDESFPDSQNQVYVGGCFALFSAETKKKAQERADYFDNDLVTNGVRFFQSFGIGAQASQLKEKKEDVSGELLQTVKTSSHKPHYLGLIRLGYQLPAKHSAFDLFNPHSADNLYRLTLIALVEIFLSETLPALLGADIAENASVSIFAGTRVKDYNDDEDGKAALNQAKYHLGLESFEEKDRHGQISKHLLYSISRDSIYPIVAHILSANKLSRHIERTVGIKLAYEKSKGNSPRFPSYFVCRKCKEIQSIDANKDIVEKNDSISNVAVVADIKLDRNNQKYGVVRPVENSGFCIVFKNEWSDIDNAKKNDLILFSQLIQNSQGRMQAKGVRLLTNDERELYEKAEKKYSLSDSVNMRCSCGSQGSFSPDYRALHYIADEVLNKIGMIKGGTGLGQAIKFAPGVFDDILNDDLQATIIACRYLNLGDIVSAIVEIKLANQGGLGKYRVKPKVLNRMACHLDNLSGEDFMRVAERISEV